MRTVVLLVHLLGVPVLAAAQQGSGASAAQTNLVQGTINAVVDGGNYARNMITKAADVMIAADYAFKPTPEVRSFGQLLAHVADSNYGFCAIAKGEKAPVVGIEKSKHTREEIKQSLADSFVYCGAVFSSLTEHNAGNIVQFQGKPRPVAGVLTFHNYHSMLHYGNMITYMRLRGKTPPSSAGDSIK